MDSPKFIIRNQANINFTTVDNYFIKDKDLSTNAKGLLIQLLALPDKWEFSKNGILSQIKEGKKFLEKYMKELQDKGYMKFDKFRNPTTGRFQYEYRIYAIPYFCEFLPDGNIYNPKTKVMDCIWNSDKPIGHSSIYEETDIRKNLITEKLKNLESKNYIKLVGKDKTHYNQRLFSPTITYIRDLFLENIESINDETRLNLMKILFSKDAENMDIYEIRKIYLSLVKTE